jgi:hypothetical protein
MLIILLFLIVILDLLSDQKLQLLAFGEWIPYPGTRNGKKMEK